MRMRRSLTAPAMCLIAMATLQVISPLVSGAAWGWNRGEKTSCTRCPACHYRCKFSAKKIDEKRHRYVADSKVICIPRVVFPWQTDNRHRCVNNGARLRRVNVLKREYYTCPECDFRWHAEKCGEGIPADERDDGQQNEDENKQHGDATSTTEKSEPTDPRMSPSADLPHPRR